MQPAVWLRGWHCSPDSIGTDPDANTTIDTNADTTADTNADTDADTDTDTDTGDTTVA